jgi:hypothetical protein
MYILNRFEPSRFHINLVTIFHCLCTANNFLSQYYCWGVGISISATADIGPFLLDQISTNQYKQRYTAELQRLLVSKK